VRGKDRLVPKFLTSICAHNNWVRSTCFSPDSRIILSGSEDKSVKLWDFTTRKELLKFTDHTDTVRSCVFHPDGTSIASGSADTKIKLWDLRSKRLLQHYDAHDEQVNKVSFHPSGLYLLSASNDSTIKVWDVRQGTILYTLYGHEGGVSAVDFSPCGDYFASGGEDAMVMTWRSNLETEDVAPSEGLVNVGGGFGNTMKPNIQTYMVSENQKLSQRGASNMAPSAMKSFGSRTDRLMSPLQDDLQPEAEFYRQPDRVETIPEAALDKVNF